MPDQQPLTRAIHLFEMKNCGSNVCVLLWWREILNVRMTYFKPNCDQSRSKIQLCPPTGDQTRYNANLVQRYANWATRVVVRELNRPPLLSILVVMPIRRVYTTNIWHALQKKNSYFMKKTNKLVLKKYFLNWEMFSCPVDRMIFLNKISWKENIS